MAGRGDLTKGVQRLVSEDKFRGQAKDAYLKHTSANSSLDILERCKRLNEFLSTDFLKGGTDQKAQLKDILGILNAGPRRPSFLDKPPLTTTASSKASQNRAKATPSTAQDASPKAPVACTSSSAPDLSGSEAEQLLALLGDSDLSSRAHLTSSSSDCGGGPDSLPPCTPTTSGAAEDVDDLIGLLNSAHTPSNTPTTSSGQPSLPSTTATRQSSTGGSAAVPACSSSSSGPAGAAAPQQPAGSSSGADPQQPAKMRQVEEVQQWRMQQQQKEQQRLDLQRQATERRLKGAQVIQRHWRAHRARVQASKVREQKRQQHAARCIQSHWRCHAAQQLMQRMRRQHAAQLQLQVRQGEAALVIQAAVRGHLARLAYRRLRLQQLRRKAAARVIQRAWRTYRRRRLGPLRVPSRGRASSAGEMRVDPALLAMPVRLRSTADTRLAKETSSGGEDPSHPAHQHRTVVTTRERVLVVKEDERRRGVELAERVQMAASSHRSNASAIQAATKQQATKTRHA